MEKYDGMNWLPLFQATYLSLKTEKKNFKKRGKKGEETEE